MQVGADGAVPVDVGRAPGPAGAARAVQRAGDRRTGSLGQPLLAVHVSPTQAEADRFHEYWEAWGDHVPLEVLVSPYRATLEPLFKGQRGGVYEVVGQLVKQWLPTQEAPIDIQSGPDETRITVGKIGVAVAKPLRGATGELTRLLHGAAAFRDNIGLANGKGTSWRDPDMRQWDSMGHAEITEFDWSA